MQEPIRKPQRDVAEVKPEVEVVEMLLLFNCTCGHEVTSHPCVDASEHCCASCSKRWRVKYTLELQEVIHDSKT